LRWAPCPEHASRAPGDSVRTAAHDPRSEARIRDGFANIVRCIRISDQSLSPGPRQRSLLLRRGASCMNMHDCHVPRMTASAAPRVCRSPISRPGLGASASGNRHPYTIVGRGPGELASGGSLTLCDRDGVDSVAASAPTVADTGGLMVTWTDCQGNEARLGRPVWQAASSLALLGMTSQLKQVRLASSFPDADR
jgi:hypothetical protein